MSHRDLRQHIIRLAAANPGIRPHLLPLLVAAEYPRAQREANLHLIRDLVARAYTAAWGHPPRATQLIEAVRLPEATRRSDDFGVKGSEVIIFTEHAGFSQYQNDKFWIAFKKELSRHHFYYEWVDGGTATIWS